MTTQNSITSTTTDSNTTQIDATDGRVKRPNVAKANADTFARKLLPVLHELAMTGRVTHGAVAAALNERGIPTARGGKWSITTVTNLIGRLAVISAETAHAATKKNV